MRPTPRAFFKYNNLEPVNKAFTNTSCHHIFLTILNIYRHNNYIISRSYFVCWCTDIYEAPFYCAKNVRKSLFLLMKGKKNVWKCAYPPIKFNLYSNLIKFCCLFNLLGFGSWWKLNTNGPNSTKKALQRVLAIKRVGKLIQHKLATLRILSLFPAYLLYNIRNRMKRLFR